MEIKKIVHNYKFLIHYMRQINPSHIYVELFTYIFDSIMTFLNSTILIRIILQVVDGQMKYSDGLVIIRKIIILDIIFIIYQVCKNMIYNTWMNYKITIEGENIVTNKAVKIKYDYFLNRKFYDRFMYCINNFPNKLQEVSQLFPNTISIIITFVLNSIVILASQYRFRVLIYIVVLLFSVYRLILNKKINQLRFDENKDLIINDRKEEYYLSDVFMNKSYAKKIKTEDKVKKVLLQEYKKNNDNMLNKKVFYEDKCRRYTNRLKILNTLVFDVFILSILLWDLWFNKNITIADFWLIFNSTKQLSNSNPVSLITKWNSMNLEMDYLRSFMGLEEENRKDNKIDINKDDIELTFEHVYYAYPNNSIPTIKDLNLTIRSSDKVLIYGENGSGKSTFILLLLRLLKPTSGKIRLNGIDIEEFDIYSYRSLFTTMFQNYCIYPLTIEKNITFDLEQADKKLMYYLFQKINLEEEINKLRDKENTLLIKEFNSDGYVPSGGIEQRMVIARTEYKDAPIAVYDEYNSKLDALSEERINQMLTSNYSNKQIVLVVSHRPSINKYIDKKIEIVNNI